MWLVATILGNAVPICPSHLINWSLVLVNWLTGQPTEGLFPHSKCSRGVWECLFSLAPISCPAARALKQFH